METESRQPVTPLTQLNDKNRAVAMPSAETLDRFELDARCGAPAGGFAGRLAGVGGLISGYAVGRAAGFSLEAGPSVPSRSGQGGSAEGILVPLHADPDDAFRAAASVKTRPGCPCPSALAARPQTRPAGQHSERKRPEHEHRRPAGLPRRTSPGRVAPMPTVRQGRPRAHRPVDIKTVRPSASKGPTMTA